MFDPEQWLIDPDSIELKDAPRTGLLSVPGMAANAAVVTAASYFVDDGPFSLVIFSALDDQGEERITNLEDFRAHGYGGPDEVNAVTQWMLSIPVTTERAARNRADISAIIKARGND